MSIFNFKRKYCIFLSEYHFHLNKKDRLRLNAALCDISSGSSLFAKGTVKEIPVYTGCESTYMSHKLFKKQKNKNNFCLFVFVGRPKYFGKTVKKSVGMYLAIESHLHVLLS